MKNLIVFCCLTALCFSFFLPVQGHCMPMVSPSLRAAINEESAESFIEVNIFMKEKAQFGNMLQQLNSMQALERRNFVIAEGKRVAGESQKNVIAFLKKMENQGFVKSVKSLWISNEINARIRKDIFEGLFAFDEIDRISLNVSFSHEILTDPAPSTAGAQAAKTEKDSPDYLWNLEMINAPDVWAKGYTGKGVIIANVDTGFDMYHTDLKDHIWTNVDEIAGNGKDDDGNGFIDDYYGWDFETNDNDPYVSYDTHGTSTSGICCGDGSGGTQTGVAPDVYMMMLKSCIDEFKARSAYEYAIENGADVITSSCSYKYFTTPPDFQAFRDGSVAELAAGVIHANSIGNQGGSTPYIPWNISSPGNAPGAFIHPSEPVQNGGITAVHGTGAVDASKNVKSYSSRGPACWQQGYPVEKPLTNPDFWDYPYYTGKPGLLKPDWSAPTDVQTIRGGGGYSSGFSGTSAATPHAGGGLALLRCAAPNATVAEISEALQMTAEDRGTAGKDNSYGAGIIDLIAAADYLVPAVTPILHPPVIATSRGATISYEATLVNNTTSSRTVSVRLDAYLPNGSPYPNNPIKKGKLTLTPGMKVIPGSNTIPSSAPLGLYTMKLTVNELNGTFISSDTFVFAVNN